MQFLKLGKKLTDCNKSILNLQGIVQKVSNRSAQFFWTYKSSMFCYTSYILKCNIFPHRQENTKKVTGLTVTSFTMALLPLLLIVLFYGGKMPMQTLSCLLSRVELALMSYVCHPTAYHYSMENKALQHTLYNREKHMDRIFSHLAGSKSPTAHVTPLWSISS